SSIAFSCSASSCLVSRLARASFNAGERSRLPTWSARKGGLVRCMTTVPKGANGEWRMANRKAPFAIRASSPPNLVSQLHHLAHLGPLLLLGEDVALLGRGEAALRAKRELLKRRELRRLVDAAFDSVLALERAALRGDDADHDDLLALGQEAQRL